MHFTIVILAILALASSASAFVVEAFSGPQCTGGSPQRVNIWDNTCGSWMNDYQSVRLVHHGGRGQVAYFCHGYCMDCRFWLAVSTWSPLRSLAVTSRIADKRF